MEHLASFWEHVSALYYNIILPWLLLVRLSAWGRLWFATHRPVPPRPEPISTLCFHLITYIYTLPVLQTYSILTDMRASNDGKHHWAVYVWNYAEPIVGGSQA
jgi:hypothetical protein